MDISSRKEKFKPFGPALLAAIFLFCYSVAVLYSHFLSGNFGFSDVTLSNDFIGNTALGKGFFRISDFGFGHFKVHFTPTLVLLSPLYLIFDSQFLLIFVGTLSFYISFVLMLFVFAEIQKLTGDTFLTSRPWLHPLAFLVLMTLNLYTKTILLSANAWFLYSGFFTVTVLLLLRGNRLWVLVPVSMLALGVRQDAGFYFSLQVASLWFLPVADAAKKSILRKRVLVLSALGALYTLVCVLWILPALGSEMHIDRGWRAYGQNWLEIGTTILTSPVRVLKDLFHGGFFGINGALLGFAIFNPFCWALSNIPGVLLYISDDISKRYLWYYTASFLLPGLILATGIGFFSLRRRFRWVGVVLVVGGVFGNLATIMNPTLSNHFRLTPTLNSEKTASVRKVIGDLEKRYPGASFAADNRSIVFVSNGRTKYLLHHYRQADVVVFADVLDGLPVNLGSAEEVRRRLAGDPDFETLEGGGNVFVHKGGSPR